MNTIKKTKTKTKTNITKSRTNRKTSPRLKINNSVVDGNKLYCINHTENTTPFWGGITCNNSIPLDTTITRWTCSSCVAMAMPAPIKRNQQTSLQIDTITGEPVARKRGRPRKHPVKPVNLDENGNVVKRGRGRPKGSKNKQR